MLRLLLVCDQVWWSLADNSRIPDCEIIGVSRGEAASRKIRETQPDLVLLDSDLRSPSALQVAAEIGRHDRRVRLIVLLQENHEHELVDYLAAGVSGWILSTEAVGDSNGALKSVLAGQALSSPQAVYCTLETLANLSLGQHLARKRGCSSLTARQTEILHCVARASSNRTIARELFLSESTVKNHVRQILKKLKAKNRLDALQLAYRRGWLDLETLGARQRRLGRREDL